MCTVVDSWWVSISPGEPLVKIGGLHTLVYPPKPPPPRLKRARNHAEKRLKNLIYALHSSKVVLLCVHRLLRIVAVPPCTKKRTVPIPREGTNRKNQGDKV